MCEHTMLGEFGMKKRAKNFIYILLLSFIVAGLISCGGGEKSFEKTPVKAEKQVVEKREEIPKEESTKAQQPVLEKKKEVVKETKVKAVEVPQRLEAIITFLSGDVSVSKDGEWEEAMIGVTLNENASLKVGEDSYCEIQFGNTASVRISANTEVSLKRVLLEVKKTDVKVGLVSGTVLCKVKKLAKDDRFKVQTPSVVCGVRGTQFGVKVDREKGTVVAVKKGAVAVLPASLDLDEMKEKLKDKSEKLISLVDRIERTAPVVKANQEIAVEKDVAKKTETTVKNVISKLEEIAKSKESLQAKDITHVEKLVSKTVAVVKKSIVPPVAMKKETREVLKPVEDIRIIEIPLPKEEIAPQKEGAQKSEKSETKKEQKAKPQTLSFALEKIGIEVMPRDAEIFLNGNPVGSGSFYGLFKPGDRLVFLIKREGFVSKEIRINVKKGSSKKYSVELEEKKETIKIEVVPPDADIIVNGESVGSGYYSNSYKWGEQLSVVAKKEGYEDSTLNIEVTKGSGGVYTLRLKRETVPITVTVSPGDAGIFLNGRLVGRGKYSADFGVGENLKFELRRDEYVSKELTIDVSREMKNTFSVKLKPKVIPFSFDVSPRKLVGKIVPAGDVFVSSDSNGNLYAVDKSGKRIWNLQTKNSPNINSSPNVIGGKVFFSGSSEFVIVEARSGNIIFRKALAGTESHMFGRRVVAFKDKVLFPTDGGVKIINPSNGKVVKDVRIPGGSKMTPAVYNGDILIVNQRGVFYRINPSGDKIVTELKTKALQPVAVSLTVKGDRVYFPGRKGTVVCVDLSKRKIVWQKKPAGAKGLGVFHDLLYGDKGIFMFSKSTIYSFNAFNGAQLFPPIKGVSAPPLYDKGYLYVGSTDGKLKVISVKTGKVIKALKIDGVVNTQPYHLGSKLIVGTKKGRLIAINLKGF